MTPYQQRQYYKEYERELNRAENYAFRRFKAVLSKQIKTVVANIQQRGVIATEADLSNIVTDQTLRIAFTDVFTKIGTQFKDFLTPRLPKTKSTPSLMVGFFSDAFVRQMQDYALNVAGTHITSITETTRKQIKEFLAESAEQNLSVRETARLMRQRFGGQMLRARALLIARTETTSAANHSQYLTAKATGLELQKEWLVRIDGRERSWHGAMKNKTVGLDENFTVNGKAMLYPGDPKGGADNLCNCRCTCVFIPKAESVEPVRVANPSPSLAGLIGVALAELLVESEE